jgi:hypothetical protein
MRLNLRPRVAIHCWGGLGSQLYAWSLRLEMEAKYPNREFYFVTHEAGVTQRDSELKNFFPFSTKQVKDFQPVSDGVSHKSRQGIAKQLRFALVRCLYFTRVIVDGDKVDPVGNLRFWTFQIRGHYSLRRISPPIRLRILESLLSFLGPSTVVRSPQVAVHYRLGDLITLSEKSPVDLSRIVYALNEVKKDISAPVFIYSDSLSQAQAQFRKFGFTVIDTSASDLLTSLIELSLSDILVGSNSKISIWAFLLQINPVNNSMAYLPNEVRHHLEANVGIAAGIRFY